MRKFFAALLAAVLVLLAAPGSTVAVGNAEPGTTARAVTARVGAPQKIYGPSAFVDSLYSTFRDARGRLHGYISNYTAISFDQRPNGSLTNPRVMLQRGRPGAVDRCGVHPAGTIYKDPRAPRSHWIAFYHAEKNAPVDRGKCNHFDDHTRWSIARMETFNGGRTWKKRGQVITQDSALLRTPAGRWSYATDDAGSPRLVVSGRFMYLFHQSANRTSGGKREMTIARAPLQTMGRPGAWKNFFKGAFTEPGLGGRSSAISGLPAAARGISFNTHLQRWVAVKVDITGAYLFQSTDLFTWTPLEQLVATGLTVSGFHKPCGPRIPAAYGYGSIVGVNGSSSTSGQSFWVYYMKKPAGQCFDHRLLYRRKVTLP